MSPIWQTPSLTCAHFICTLSHTVNYCEKPKFDFPIRKCDNFFLVFTGSQPGSVSPSTENRSNQDGFVVNRGRTVPTLTSVVDKSDKEQFNKDTKSDELGESIGTPSSSSRDRHSDTSDNDVFAQMKNIPVAGRPSESPTINSNSVTGSARRASKPFSR